MLRNLAMRNLARGLMLAILLMNTNIPALAGQWLIYRNQELLPYLQWSGDSEPQKGTNIAETDTALPWSIINNDGDCQHYQNVDGSIVYVPPPAPVVIEGPLRSKFINLCLRDADCKLSHLSAAFCLVEESLTDAQRKVLWTRLKSLIGVLDPGVVAMESYGQTCKMPLK